MEIILNYFNENKLFGIFVVMIITYVISRMVVPSKTAVSKKDLVPAYKRFERREGETGGDRRGVYALAYAGINRRQGMRRVEA